MTSPSSLIHDSYYHIFNRGVNKENIFKEEMNNRFFLDQYVKYISPISQTFAYCLMKNHFHFLLRILSTKEIIDTIRRKYPENQYVEIPDDYASRCFSNFFNSYSKGINKKYSRTGSIFQHPFGRVYIRNDEQFDRVIAYIHQNPQKHRFVKDFRLWKYSSYYTFVSEKETVLQRKIVLEWFGGKEEYLRAHEQMVSEVESNIFKDD